MYPCHERAWLEDGYSVGDTMQQMLFARPSPGISSAAWTGSDSGSPRRVTFAAKHATPSPVHDRRGQQSRVEESPYAEDLTEETRVQRRQQPRRQQKTQRSEGVARPTVATRTRRPGWDADVVHGSTLFDASLKRSLLFQPKAGDRRKEENGTSSLVVKRRTSTAVSTKNKPTATRTPVRYRSGPSSVYAQQHQNVTHWPQRKRKDFVRQNIEHLTGRPADAPYGRSVARSGTGENVFERLSAPRVSKALLRSHMQPFQAESEQSPGIARSPSASSLSPLQEPALVQSPVLTIDPPTPDKQHSPRSATPSPGVRRSGLGWSSPYSSPQRSQQSFSSRHSPTPRSNSTNRSNGGGSRSRRYDNYPARVFGVLDRGHEQRIGVSQILQGLRLLGLPATHNQISDYVYLIHEGQHNTIDLEEWEILVGTLDAASRPSSHSPHGGYTSQGIVMPSRSPPSCSISGRSPYDDLPSSNSPYETRDQLRSPTHKSRDHDSTKRTNHTPYEENEHYTTSVQRKTIVSAEHQPISDDDPYLVEIQNRIEGMFERAQATAALRWSPELGNNQAENDPDDSRSDRILKRAATVVYSLRASLFPLVHQAEATLREIQQRHGSKLSLFLPPGDMAMIAQNSDMLASAILDDILLDTVQLLNDEDKQQSCHQLEANHAGQLDDIMARIQEIEQAENTMIRQGLALNFETQGVKCALPTASFQDDPTQVTPKPEPYENSNLPNLTLPLEVVMNINVPDSPLMYHEPQDTGAVRSSALGGDEFVLDRLNITLQKTFAEHPVRTSILQGKRLQSIERKRHKFQQHRRLVESSLAETGLAQFAVIEILEEMLLDDLVEHTAAELNDTVLSMSDMLMTSLL